MQENYMISIVGKQQADGETGEIRLETLGSYVQKGDHWYIVYKEYDEDNPNRYQTSILKVEKNDKVTLMRGNSSTRLILEKGKRHLCQYDTGYGTLMVGVFTSSFDSTLDASGGSLQVRYTLDINSALSSNNEILITVKEAASQMSKLVQQATEQLRAAIVNSMEEAVKAGDLAQAPLPAFNLEIPADHSHGDWSCNAAMAGAKAFRAAPRKIAEAIVSHLDLSATYFDRVEIAGPGFLNFFFSPRFQSDVLRDILALDENYGRSDYGQGKKVMVEFVSANPTGPMHMGNARGGALGDCLAAVLDAAGYDVWREFYVNDAGNQIEKFGLSLSIRYQQLFAGENAPELPEDSYHGEDILDLAKAYADEHGDCLMEKTEEERRAALVAFGLPRNIAKMKADMKKYRIEYDEWFLESTLHQSGAVKAVVDLLTEKGLTYEQEGAIWYKGADFTAKYAKVKTKDDEQPKTRCWCARTATPPI